MASFEYGEFYSGVDQEGYQAIMNNDVISGLIAYYGTFTQYGSYWIFSGDEDGLISELELEGLDFYWGSFRYVGSAAGFFSYS